MLENVATNIIQPNLATLQSEVNSLDDRVQAFATSTTDANLLALQNQWEKTYLIWQHCSALNFGPGNTSLGKLNRLIGAFPANTTKIDEFISSKNFSLDNSIVGTRGFIGLEYLIYDANQNNQTVLASYQGASGEDRKSYLKAVSLNIKSVVDNVVSGWATYKAEFIANDGASAGGSVNILFNEFNINYEEIKNFKLGLPLGKRPGQTTTAPQQVEGYYSGKSLLFIKEHLNAIENLYYGKSMSGENGLGFDDYLRAVTGGEELLAETETQWRTVREELNKIPITIPLSTQIQNNPSSLNALYEALSNQTRYFKSDMVSLLGFFITYSSGDGD